MPLERVNGREPSRHTVVQASHSEVHSFNNFSSTRSTVDSLGKWEIELLVFIQVFLFCI